MLRQFRTFNKTKIGTLFMAGIFLIGLAGFAVGDLYNVGTGKVGFSFGMDANSLAKVGDQKVSEQEMEQAMQRRLNQVREQQPEASYATISGDFDKILDALIDERTLIAFADKYGFHLSKRLIDAEIANIPAAKGLNGQFSQQAYNQFLQQQRLTDQQVRDVIAGSLLQRMLLAPVAGNARIAVAMAKPYASMMLEAREGEAAAIPVELFRAGLNPTDAQLQQYYTANRARYMIPEQRVIRFARIGAEQVAANVSDQDIAAYYNSHKADYAAKDTRTITQAVVQNQAAANAIAAKVKSGSTIAAAAGTNAAVTTITDQSRDAYAGAAGGKVADAVFSASKGSIVGPVQGDFGWVVAKVDSIKSTGGKTLDQAKPEIAAKLKESKAKEAIEDTVDKVQDAIDNNGTNFTEAAAQAKLPITQTPLIVANGTSRVDPNFKAAPELAAAIKTGFDISPSDPPEIVSAGEGNGYVLVSPGQVVPAAPAPLASIRQQVANDWINAQAMQRAHAAAAAIVAKTSRGMSLADAMKQSGVALPPSRPIAARRIQLAEAQDKVPVALQMLFTLGPGKSQLFNDPQGRGYYIVKVDKITSGNAMFQPQLISRMQTDLRDAVSQDYATEFQAAVRSDMKVKRNEDAIRALRARMSSAS
jgi:peptidyl-prolyl cis-trans isomerase D